MKKYTCCFAGPGPERLPFSMTCRSLRRDFLYERILSAIVEKRKHDHCRTFLCGMEQGADLLCAQAVLELKEEFCASIRLACVLTYPGQAEDWPKKAREQYQCILERADKRIVLQDEETNGCLLAQKRFMIKRSSHLIAVSNGIYGGLPAYAMDYARKRGLSITVIEPALPSGHIL